MSDQNDSFTAVKVWAAAAWADGVIADEEKLTMKAIIKVGKLSDAQRTEAAGWIEKPISLDDVDLDALDADNRANIYAAACGLIAIDKDVAEAETAFLGRLQQALELDDDTAAAIHAKAGV